MALCYLQAFLAGGSLTYWHGDLAAPVHLKGQVCWSNGISQFFLSAWEDLYKAP